MRANLALCLLATGLGSGTALGDEKAPPPSRYAAYWLLKPDDDSGMRVLLITRVPLAELPTLMELQEGLDRPGVKRLFVPQLLDLPGLTITTYGTDSISNEDGIALKPLKRFKNLDEKARTVETDGGRRRYEACPLADAVRLLKNPEGKEPINRIYPPLVGMEQTARALRLLLEEQIREDAAKKK